MGSDLSADAMPGVEVLRQGLVKGCGGIDQDVVDVLIATIPFVCGDELVHRLPVGGLDLMGLRQYFLSAFHIPEDGIPAEVEGSLRRIQDVKNDDFVLIVPEMFQGGENLPWVVEEVAE